MQFTYEITIPVNTVEDSPTREVTPLCYGILKGIQIDFPWGCAGLVGIRVVHFEHQLYPTNLDGWFIGNNISIPFACEYPILVGWSDFKIEGYNEDDFYPHTPIVNFNVLPGAGDLLSLQSWAEG